MEDLHMNFTIDRTREDRRVNESGHDPSECKASYTDDGHQGQPEGNADDSVGDHGM
jgi:hypothetical protein